MRNPLRRITLIACGVAAVMLPLRILFSKGTDLVQPRFGPVMEDGEITGMEASGKIAFSRGGRGPRAIIVGTADFEAVLPGTSVSTSQVIDLLESGEISHRKIDWRINWGSLVGNLAGTWFFTALFYWWLTRPEPVPGPAAIPSATKQEVKDQSL